MDSLQITYLGNSGFAVEAERGKTLLVFDCCYDGEVDPSALAKYDRVLVFISHSHGDHYNPVVKGWAASGAVTYVVSEDVEKGFAAHRMKPGARLSLLSGAGASAVEVEAFGSTDIGVSFLIRIGGWSVFHAGDLNCWHWQDESTAAEADAARAEFAAILATIAGRSVDLAFFPVDPRLGTDYDEGALTFVDAVKPRAMVPMHYRERTDAPEAFQEKAAGTRVLAFTARGQSRALDASDLE